MSNPYLQPQQSPQQTGQPNPWASGSGFGNLPAANETFDVLSGSSYQPYRQPTSSVEPNGLAAPQFPGASQYLPATVQSGGAQPYSGFAEAPEHPNAGTVMGLGIASIVMLFFGFPITGPFAWYMGSKARREMRDNPGRWRESSNLTAGWVMGIITSIIMILGLALLLFMVLGLMMFATGG